MTWPPSLVVSVSDYGTRGEWSIPRWASILQWIFSVFMLNYFKQVILNYKNGNYHSLTYYIELCSKYVGVGLNLALLKNN